MTTIYRMRLLRLVDALHAVVEQDRSFASHTCALRFASEEAADEFNAAWIAADEYLRAQRNTQSGDSVIAASAMSREARYFANELQKLADSAEYQTLADILENGVRALVELASRREADEPKRRKCLIGG